MIDAFLALNRENESQLWPLDERALRVMLAHAYLASVADDASAMLIAFDERAPYESPNFAWFRERYPRFVYVDRVAVARHARGRGLGRRLYEELIAKARADGHTILCAELYSAPPNRESEAFHAAMGFREVGRAHLAERGKSVSYVVRDL
ncbi:MAG TPA: GNAT family N-acetyltransferase [Candidatus Acidoferrales bacterium]|nr:GNAT family N-acetyltransferase [Candidatus Acidoferrales bacterium]